MTDTKEEITKYIVINLDNASSDITMMIYRSEFSVTVKETCFGLSMTGPKEDVLAVVKKIRQLKDKNYIFIKDRGFPVGDRRRCRGTKGGPRPGFHFLKEEVKMLPAIGAALDKLEAKEFAKEKRKEKCSLEVSDYEKVIGNNLNYAFLSRVFIYPVNSLILSDLVDRFGHKPLVVMSQVRKKVTNVSIDSPPINITPEDPKLGLRYAAVEVPSGVRGRMALMGSLIEEAESAIIVENPPTNFGCLGCDRANELLKYLIRSKEIPVLQIKYPESYEEARNFVNKIAEFLESVSNKKIRRR
jgi:putative methanogenesis marker protein 5/putative methanogenesis marker protein 6